jgi:hypothetical protein
MTGSAGDANTDPEHVGERQRALVAEAHGERPEGEVLHRDVGLAVGGEARLEHRHDVRMAGEAPGRRALAGVSTLRLLVDHLDLEDLQRDRSVEVLLVRGEDGAKPPRPMGWRSR